jgi:hypothetical protein
VLINIFYYEATLCEVQLNCPASPGEIERLFAEMEVPSGFHEFNMNSSGIYVSPSEITIRETDEPLLTIADLPPVFDFYLKLSMCTMVSDSICLSVFMSWLD